MRFIDNLNRFEFVFLFPNHHEIGTEWNNVYSSYRIIGGTDWWLSEYIDKKLFIDSSTSEVFRKQATWRSTWRLNGH